MRNPDTNWNAPTHQASVKPSTLKSVWKLKMFSHYSSYPWHNTIATGKKPPSSQFSKRDVTYPNFSGNFTKDWLLSYLFQSANRTTQSSYLARQRFELTVTIVLPPAQYRESVWKLTDSFSSTKRKRASHEPTCLESAQGTTITLPCWCGLTYSRQLRTAKNKERRLD